MNEEKPKLKIVVLHESLLESWLKDIVMFGLLAIMLWANVRWFGDHAIVALAFVAMIIIALVARSPKLREDFYDKESAKKFIDEL